MSKSNKIRLAVSRSRTAKPVPTSETQLPSNIEVHRLQGGPEGFYYAVLDDNKIMGWFTTAWNAEQFALSLRLLEVFKKEMGVVLLDSLYGQLHELRYQIGPVNHILPRK